MFLAAYFFSGNLSLKLTLSLCSVAKKSSLEEWTSRANLCDRLHIPVCSNSCFYFVMSLLLLIPSSFPKSFMSFIYRLELPWLASIQAFQILIYLY